MDDLRFGAAVRTARIRRGWRQLDLAHAAGVSDATVSRIERGRLDGLQLATIRQVAAAVDVRLELLPRSRGADLERVLNAKHAALTEAIVRWLSRLDGWQVRPEVSFSWYGERGVVDVLAWHAGRRALLEVEAKTEIVDSGELLGTLDRRRRLGPQIASSIGWETVSISTLLVIGESDANRRRVRGLGGTFQAALPDRIVAVRRYLRDPDQELRAMMFFSDRLPGQANSRFAASKRVRLARRPIQVVNSHSVPT